MDILLKHKKRQTDLLKTIDELRYQLLNQQEKETYRSLTLIMIRHLHTLPTTFSWKIVNLSMESSYLLLLLFWDDDVLDLNAAKNPFLGVAVAVVESVVSAFWPKLLLPLLSFFIFLSQLILYTLYYFCATLISIWQCFKNS